MKPFELFARQGKPNLWTPDEGKLFELAGQDPNTATLWVYHLHLEPEAKLSEPDAEGWMQILPPTKIYDDFGHRIREIDAPVPPWKKLGGTTLRATN